MARVNDLSWEVVRNTFKIEMKLKRVVRRYMVSIYCFVFEHIGRHHSDLLVRMEGSKLVMKSRCGSAIGARSLSLDLEREDCA